MDYEHLVYFSQVSSKIFWTNQALYGKKHPDSFKVTVDKNCKETYHIESSLYKQILGENK